MLKKTILQGLFLVCIFFATWFVLQQLDWIRIFRVEHLSKKTEEKLGELFWDFFRKAEKEIQNKEILDTVDSLLSAICIANEIDHAKLKLHILRKEEINAFALPDRHIVLYSGLIKACDNPEALCGVLSHELAHIELEHVKKKLVKEVGLSVLLGMATGNAGSDLIQNAAKILSSTAFDRNLEKEADRAATAYLINAKIDPKPFGDFLLELAKEEDASLAHLSWISTHPDTRERAKEILRQGIDPKYQNACIIHPGSWDKAKELLRAEMN